MNSDFAAVERAYRWVSSRAKNSTDYLSAMVEPSMGNPMADCANPQKISSVFWNRQTWKLDEHFRWSGSSGAGTAIYISFLYNISPQFVAYHYKKDNDDAKQLAIHSFLRRAVPRCSEIRNLNLDNIDMLRESASLLAKAIIVNLAVSKPTHFDEEIWWGKRVLK